MAHGKIYDSMVELIGSRPSTPRFVDPTSDNKDILLALVATKKEYDIKLVIPESMPVERRKMLKFLGVSLELTPADKDRNGAIARAEKLPKKGYVQLGQFINPSNPLAHQDATAFEILQDIDNGVDEVNQITNETVFTTSRELAKIEVVAVGILSGTTLATAFRSCLSP